MAADDHGRRLVEYVHPNPVRPRSRGVPIPAERAAALVWYEWSSHRDYAARRMKPAGWLCLDWQRYWGKDVATAQREYRQAIARWFMEPVENPWREMRSGLVLGGQELLAKAREMIGRIKGLDEARWTVVEQAIALQDRVRELVKNEPDDVKIWARVHLGGEKRVTVAQEFGYRDGSGLTHLLQALAQEADGNSELRQQLKRLKQIFSSFKS